MEFNKYQTPLTEDILNPLPQEVKDQLFDIIYNVKFIKNLISPDRQYAKDRPRDDKGRIIVDLANPHIVENVDYFRPSALHYQKYGCFTNLRPNSNPNSEYGKWIREEKKRCWEGYIRPSDGEWVTGYMYWFLNYSPIMLSKIIKGTKRANRVEDFPEFWEGIYWRFHYMEQAFNGGLYNGFEGGQHCAELASRGKGKAHPYSEIVYTPNGKKLWGDIKVGDLLYNENGSTTKVIDIPFDDIAPIYKITFSNGETVECSEGHLWEVQNHGKTLILSTKELLRNFRSPRKITLKTPKGYENNYTILNPKGVEIPEKATYIDPYTFGLLLGDGCFRYPKALNRVYFTSSDEDFETYSKLIPYRIIKYNNKYEYGIEISNIGDYLKSVGLYMVKSEDKFIPDEYKFNSKKVRTELLKGILDSDGTVTKGKIEIVLTSKRMIDDIKWILSSLGIPYTKKRVKYAFYYDRNNNKIPCKNAYRLSIFSNSELFNLSRKLNLWKNRSISNYGQSKYKGIRIVNIEYLEEKRSKCVTVDNPNHKYLIGNFIPTHNSFSLASILSHDFILGVNKIAHSKVMSVVTAYQREYLTKDGVLNKFSSMANFCAEHTQFPRKRLKSSMQEMTWVMGYKDVDLDIERGTLNNILGVSSKDDESKLRGKRAAHILIEEFGTFPRLVDMYNVLTPSVEEGDIVFGQIYMLGCVCAGTKVWTLDGRNINIEDLKKEDGIIGYSKLPVVKDNYIIHNNGITRESIGKVIEPINKECIEIILSNGNTLKCSIDHPILVQSKHSKRVKGDIRETIFKESFIKAQDIKIGDRICECRKINIFGKDTLFDNRLVGMLIGDGSYGKNETPKFSSEDSELLNYIKSKYSISLSATHITKKGNIYEDIRIKNICKHLRIIGIYGQTGQLKRLPINYQTLTESSIMELLSGLYDTDGTFYNKGTRSYIGLTQCNKEILEEVKLLWRKFGVVSSIQKINPRINKNRIDKNPWYNLVINGAINLRIASEVLSPIVAHKRESNIGIKTFFKAYTSKKPKGYDKDYLIHKVVNIKSIGRQTVYNLSACTSRTYLANNIITHNTAGDNESDFAGAQEINNIVSLHSNM